jgi:microcystin-dependent protein
MAVPATWAWYLERPSGPYLGSLVAARTRKLSFTLDGAAQASFTMPGSHPETALVAELATDVVCVRGGRTMFRGRVQASQDTLSADADTVAFTAVDYRGMLDRRLLWSNSTLSFRGADQADIAWQMIVDTQAQTGGNLGITRGAAAATGILRDRDYQAGKPVGEAIAQLGECQNGFDWEIDPNLAFNLYYPSRGRQTGLVLAWGRDLAAINQTYNQAGYANAIWYSGSNSTTPVETAVATMPSDIGRWDAQKSDPNLILQQTLSDQAAYELATASDFEPAFGATLIQGVWDPNQLFVGDQAQIVADTGRLNVNTVRRIVGVDVDLSDDGAETVTLTLGDATATLTGRLQSYNSRISSLERGLGYIPDAPVGAMFDWPGAAPPALFAWADGSALSTAAYPELFAVLGYTYGGSGTSFNLPDCRGRMTVAAGQGTGLTNRPAASVGGAETVALAAANNAAHTHTLTGQATGANDVSHAHDWSATSSLGTAAHTHPAGGLNTQNPNVQHTHNVPLAAVGTGSGAWGVSSAPTTQYGTGVDNQAHQHVVAGSTGGDSGHQHTVSGTSATQSSNHHHVLTGASDAQGSGAAFGTMPPFIAIGKVIKTLSAQAAGTLMEVPNVA